MVKRGVDAINELICGSSVAFIMSDDGRTYMNISEEYDANHETVQHNKRFVNA